MIVLTMFAALERLREALNVLYHPAGLNEHKFLVMTALAEQAPAPASPSELARRARITRSSMTDVLDDLERRTWVRSWRASPRCASPWIAPPTASSSGSRCSCPSPKPCTPTTDGHG
jgi:hypothetical protein